MNFQYLYIAGRYVFGILCGFMLFISLVNNNGSGRFCL